jgi:hypothetical protein
MDKCKLREEMFGIKWDKVPSVTYGGAVYFYNTWVNEKKYTVIFDRQAKLWKIIDESKWNGKEYVYETYATDFKTATQAMRYFENNCTVLCNLSVE